MKRKGPELLSHQARAVLRQHGGTSIVLGLFFLGTLGWLADGWYDFLTEGIAWLVGTRAEPFGIRGELARALALSLPFAVVFLTIWSMARRAAERLGFRVEEDANPAQRKALILFVSAPQWEAQEKALQEDLAVRGDLEDPATLEKIQGVWRMPLEAIAYHRNRLERVVLIFSGGDGGSYERAQTFLDWLREIWPQGASRLRTHSEVLAAWQDGVDFVDVSVLVEVTDAIFRELLAEGFSRDEILIDITSGTKLASAAGVAVALAEGRHFQYVHKKGDSFKIASFNPVYRQED